MQNIPPRLSRIAASEYLLSQHGITRKPATLAKLASIGGGPKFQHANRTPLYTPTDLDAWVASLLSPTVAHTSEAVKAKISATTPL